MESPGRQPVPNAPHWAGCASNMPMPVKETATCEKKKTRIEKKVWSPTGIMTVNSGAKEVVLWQFI